MYFFFVSFVANLVTVYKYCFQRACLVEVENCETFIWDIELTTNRGQTIKTLSGHRQRGDRLRRGRGKGEGRMKEVTFLERLNPGSGVPLLPEVAKMS